MALTPVRASDLHQPREGPTGGGLEPLPVILLASIWTLLSWSEPQVGPSTWRCGTVMVYAAPSDVVIGPKRLSASGDYIAFAENHASPRDPSLALLDPHRDGFFRVPSSESSLERFSGVFAIQAMPDDSLAILMTGTGKGSNRTCLMHRSGVSYTKVGCREVEGAARDHAYEVALLGGRDVGGVLLLEARSEGTCLIKMADLAQAPAWAACAPWVRWCRVVAVEDWDGDGTPDILGAQARAGRTFAVLASGASGSVIEEWPLPFDSRVCRLQLLLSHDLDGDGRRDLVAGSPCFPPGAHRGRVDIFGGAGGGVLGSLLGESESWFGCSIALIPASAPDRLLPAVGEPRARPAWIPEAELRAKVRPGSVHLYDTSESAHVASVRVGQPADFFGYELVTSREELFAVAPGFESPEGGIGGMFRVTIEVAR